MEPVFNDFIIRYTDFTALKAADVEEIRGIIESLGLRKKAEGLRRLSDQVIEYYDGEVPSDVKELMGLHFVGRYTANSVLSHAYGVSKPTYDNNFGRVIDRFFGLELGKPLQKDKRGFEFAEDLMERVADGHGEFNLNIIDFAEKVCMIRKPTCTVCPLNERCGYSEKNKCPIFYIARGFIA